MTLKEMVRRDFEEFIRIDQSVPEDLRRALKLNERVPVFIDKLAAEFAMCEKRGIKISRLKIKETTYDMARMFVHFVKKRADEIMMSDLAKTHARKALEGDELTQKMDAEGNIDASEELGIIITDKSVKKGPH